MDAGTRRRAKTLPPNGGMPVYVEPGQTIPPDTGPPQTTEQAIKDGIRDGIALAVPKALDAVVGDGATTVVESRDRLARWGVAALGIVIGALAYAHQVGASDIGNDVKSIKASMEGLFDAMAKAHPEIADDLRKAERELHR